MAAPQGTPGVLQCFHQWRHPPRISFVRVSVRSCLRRRRTHTHTHIQREREREIRHLSYFRVITRSQTNSGQWSLMSTLFGTLRYPGGLTGSWTNRIHIWNMALWK